MLPKTQPPKNPYRARKADGRISAREKEQIVLQHCDLVKYMAFRLVSRLPGSVQVDDLFNAGIIGLIDAIDKFDPEQGIQFETYAKIRVRGAMLDEIRSMDWIPRSLRQKGSVMEKTCLALEQRLGREASDEELAGELGISLDEYFGWLDEIKGISILPEDIHDAGLDNDGSLQIAGGTDDLFHTIHRAELKEHLSEAIGSLSEKEQLILSLYYYDELTMKEVGAVLGYTESRISQIHTKAMLRLRSRLSRKLKKEDLPEHLKIGEV
jgi:RNA polymerase sigma factor for flagellar operon FliA